MALTIPLAGAADSGPITLEFISLQEGATPPDNVLEGTDYAIGERSFLAAGQIVRTVQEVDGLPTSLMPIADESSGNTMCYAPQGVEFGSVLSAR